MADTSGVMTRSQKSEAAFWYVITNLFHQDMDGSISLSLLEYTGQNIDVSLIINISDTDIDDLHFFRKTLVTPPNTDSDAKPVSVDIRYELPRAYKKLVKIFTSFQKWMVAAGEPIFYDWSNVESQQFETYRFKIFNVNTSTPIPPNLSPSSSTISSSGNNNNGRQSHTSFSKA